MSAILSLSLLAALAGCNRGAGDAKKANVDKSPKNAPIAAAPVDARPPATFAARDLAKVIDVGALIKVDPKGVREQNVVLFDADARGKLDDVLKQCVKELAAKGWKMFEPEGSRPVNDEFGSVQFAKDGHVVKVEVSKTSPEPKTGAPRTAVTIRFHGNLDARTLPRPAGSERVMGTQIMSAHHSDNSVADEAAWILKALKADGWQEYSRFDDRGANDRSADFGSYLLRKHGYSIGVLLAKLPNGKKTAVTYTVDALANELPAPPESTKIEFDDAAGKLRGETPGDWKAAAAFYAKAMPEAGYKAMPGEEAKPTYQNLRFNSDAGDIVMVQVSSKDGKTTSILMDVIPAAVVKQLEKANRPPEIAPAPKILTANDVPLPGDAKDVKDDPAREEITFRADAEIAPLVAQLRGRLTAAGWQEDMSTAVINKRSGLLSFRMGPATLRVVLVNEGRGTQATISATGLTWQKSP